jgi:membrane protein CcdC involved in cytochrome C biogenesis
MQYSEDLIFVVFIAAMLLLRMRRNSRGQRFSRSRVLRLPAIYLIITLISLFGIPEYAILLTFALGVIGLLVGLLAGEGVSVFTKDSNVYYRRSPIVFSAYIVLLLLRYAVYILYPANMTANAITAALLGLSTGLILGEAFHINRAAAAEGAKLASGNAAKRQA